MTAAEAIRLIGNVLRGVARQYGFRPGRRVESVAVRPPAHR